MEKNKIIIAASAVVMFVLIAAFFVVGKSQNESQVAQKNNVPAVHEKKMVDMPEVMHESNDIIDVEIDRFEEEEVQIDSAIDELEALEF